MKSLICFILAKTNDITVFVLIIINILLFLINKFEVHFIETYYLPLCFIRSA